METRGRLAACDKCHGTASLLYRAAMEGRSPGVHPTVNALQSKTANGGRIRRSKSPFRATRRRKRKTSERASNKAGTENETTPIN